MVHLFTILPLVSNTIFACDLYDDIDFFFFTMVPLEISN